MKTILVDDEVWSVQMFLTECENSSSFDIVGTFTDPQEALEFSRRVPIEFALLDIEMPGMNGLELGAKLRDIYPDIVIIYVTAYGKYALEAMHQKADYFVTKPYSAEDVEDALRRVLLLSQRQKKRVYIRTFGKFDVFVDEKAINFSSKKAKELLALLVDRNGGVVSNAEALYAIWEDETCADNRLRLCRKAYDKLTDILEANGISDLVIKGERGRMLNKHICDADYFNFLSGNKKAVEEFSDVYLEGYSWGEETLAKLFQMKHKTGR